MKKPLTILLFATILLSAVTSCGTSETETETSQKASQETATASHVETEDPLADNLPERDYEGKDFNIWGDVYEYVYFYDNELTGDVIDDAVYNRNIELEERFNIKFQYDLYEAFWRDVDMFAMRNSILAGSGTYDIITGVTDYLCTHIIAGVFQNINRMEYIDLSRQWWCNYVNDDAMIGDRLYMASGYYDIPSISRTVAVFYSTELANQFKIENLYELVHDGKWTFDRMISLAEQVCVDTDGNGEMNEKDVYGLTSQHDIISPLYLTSYSFIERDTDGSMRIMPVTEALVDVNSMFYNILHTSEWYYDGYPFGGPHNYENMESVFTSDQALFFINQLRFASKGILREMGTYGLLPTPKLVESQQDYCSFTSAFATAIPIDVSDVEYSSIILEALQAESYKKVLPAYYETALSKKFLNDAESVEILDIITANVRCDFSGLYSLVAVWGYDLAYSVGLYENYASWYETRYNSYNTGLQEMVHVIESLQQ